MDRISRAGLPPAARDPPRRGVAVLSQGCRLPLGAHAPPWEWEVGGAASVQLLVGSTTNAKGGNRDGNPPRVPDKIYTRNRGGVEGKNQRRRPTGIPAEGAIGVRLGARGIIQPISDTNLSYLLSMIKGTTWAAAAMANERAAKRISRGPHPGWVGASECGPSSWIAADSHVFLAAIIRRTRPRVRRPSRAGSRTAAATACRSRRADRPPGPTQSR